MLGIPDFHLGETKTKGKGSKGKSSDKDLQRLNRKDLLELLVGQMHEGDELRASIEQKDREIEELAAMGDRLKEKLDLKDEQIENLKSKLDLKDEQIENLKGKLNDKDAKIDKLKDRLDAKDVLIAKLSESQEMSEDELALFDALEHAVELTKARRENGESSNG